MASGFARPCDRSRRSRTKLSRGLAAHTPVDFEPAANEASLPKQFQLGPHRFEARLKPLETVSETFTISEVTFPSPIVTSEENNNTIHCEYFRPVAPGPHPGVIVLHILGGDFDLARLFARSLADQGVAALFLKMPYYGPRRTPDSKARMVSFDPEATVRGMTQAVLDIRQATAWLGEQAEIDGERLGIMGSAWAGITSGPWPHRPSRRLQNICLILAGGDIGQVAWDSPHHRSLRQRWAEAGGNARIVGRTDLDRRSRDLRQECARPADFDAQCPAR